MKRWWEPHWLRPITLDSISAERISKMLAGTGVKINVHMTGIREATSEDYAKLKAAIERQKEKQ